MAVSTGPSRAAVSSSPRSLAVTGAQFGGSPASKWGRAVATWSPLAMRRVDIVRDGFQMACDGILIFPSFDDGERPLRSSSEPKGRFPSLLRSSLFSTSSPIASRCGGSAHPRQLPGSRFLQSCGQKFEGLLVPRCRVHEVLLILSLIVHDIAIFGEKLKRGWILGGYKPVMGKNCSWVGYEFPGTGSRWAALALMDRLGWATRWGRLACVNGNRPSRQLWGEIQTVHDGFSFYKTFPNLQTVFQSSNHLNSKQNLNFTWFYSPK
jgi:hypothetical protein